jgi:hypothetical protein
MPNATGVTRFNLLRYSLVPFQQLELLPVELPPRKGEAVLSVIVPGAPPSQFAYRGHPFVFAGFTFAAGPLQVPEQRQLLVGRLAKHKLVGLGELTEEDIVERLTDDWIPVWVVFDMSRQYIGVEVNSKFGRLDHVIAVMQSGLGPGIEERYRHEILIAPVTDSRRFWDIVTAHKYLYEIKLHFLSPNIFGAPASAREALEQWRRVFNQTETMIGLKNKEGSLRADEASLREPVQYIADGEGDWRVTAARALDAPRRSFSSKQMIEQFDVEIPRASEPIEDRTEAASITRRLLDRFSHILADRHVS